MVMVVFFIRFLDVFIVFLILLLFWGYLGELVMCLNLYMVVKGENLFELNGGLLLLWNLFGI